MSVQREPAASGTPDDILTLEARAMFTTKGILSASYVHNVSVSKNGPRGPIELSVPTDFFTAIPSSAHHEDAPIDTVVVSAPSEDTICFSGDSLENIILVAHSHRRR